MPERERPDLDALEKKKVDELRRISSDLDSSDYGRVYTAAGKMMACPNGKSLLAKAISQLNTDEPTMMRLAIRTVAKNVYGEYIQTLFRAFESINPAETEQVLLLIEESFQASGGPRHPLEQTYWIDGLARLSHEHQPTVFGIMAYLCPKGQKWVIEKIQRHIESLVPGSIQKLRVFPDTVRVQILKVLIRESSTRRRDLLPHIMSVIDSKTIQLIMPYLKQATWQERVEIAMGVGRVGIITTAGVVMEIVSDSDWRVKQSFADSIDISKSRFTALLRVLEFLAADSHTRVRSSAERLMLLLGIHACSDCDIDTQRERLMRKFRKQMLEATPTQKDIDTSWLGLEIPDRTVFPVFTDEEAAQESRSIHERGITLTELSRSIQSSGTQSPSSRSELLALLLKKRQAAFSSLNSEEHSHDTAETSSQTDSGEQHDNMTEDKTETVLEDTASDNNGENDIGLPEDIEHVIEDQAKTSAAIDSSGSPVDIVISLLKQVSSNAESKDIAESELRRKALKKGLNEHDFETAIRQLERDGLIYKSGRNRLRYVDLSL